VQRDIDENESDNLHVIVHRDIIASGERIIKNGTLKDDLAKQYNVLCFKIETAGALADFPCIIIREISDYYNSHKNDQWHGYAAVTAAAYTRQLFFHIPINEVKQYILAQETFRVPSQG
jgi:nucleoside phosphorylase